LAACLSETGASRVIFNYASTHRWQLICTPYGISETECNLAQLPAKATETWSSLKTSLTTYKDIWSIDRPSVFPITKDKPILFSALAWADILLTLDQADFHLRTGNYFYGLQILRPGQFLEQQRTKGLLFQ
jgi:predicted nucleic acid-binding protein